MKIRKHLIFLFALILSLAACGGGGGSAGGNDDGGGGDGGGGGGSGDGGTDTPTTNGAAEITFPWTHSSATAPTVSIRGIASDPEGVARVTINGVDATITATATASAQGHSAKGGLAEGEVEWSAEIDLDDGENVLVVSVEDEAGDVTEEVDTATIDYFQVPTTFTLDPERTRVVGLRYTLASSGYEQNLVQHNYDTLEQAVFEGLQFPAPEHSCFRAFQDEFLYLSFFTGTWELRKYDLATGQDSLLLEIDNGFDPGPGFQPTPFVGALVCDSDHTSAYVLANYVNEDGSGAGPESGFAKSRVLEIELASGIVTVLTESDTSLSPPWLAQTIALAEDAIVAMEDINPRSALTRISLSDGSRTFLTPGVAVGGAALDPDLGSGRVYVATFEGVDELDLNTTPATKRNISPVDDAHPLAFSQMQAIAFDAANNRVIVGDSDLDALIAVDISTGERSEFLSHKVGTGNALIAPREFALTADETRAYVADDGSNVPARLFEVDLATGDRRVIGDISQPFHFFVTGLALDEAGGRVFVAINDSILEVDLESERVQTIASADSSDLESIEALVFDGGSNRLLVGDFTNDGIFALDLTTHAVEVISQENVRGGGPGFGGVVSMTRGAATSELYVAGQTSGNVVRVDLETGDREALAATCDQGLAPPVENLNQVLYNDALNELIISGDQLFSLDLGTSACTTLPLRADVSPLNIQVTPTNEMLVVTFGALAQFDRVTGEIVIVSK